MPAAIKSLICWKRRYVFPERRIPTTTFTRLPGAGSNGVPRSRSRSSIRCKCAGRTVAWKSSMSILITVLWSFILKPFPTCNVFLQYISKPVTIRYRLKNPTRSVAAAHAKGAAFCVGGSYGLQYSCVRCVSALPHQRASSLNDFLPEDGGEFAQLSNKVGELGGR